MPLPPSVAAIVFNNMKNLLSFYAVRYSTKKNKRDSYKRQWLLPFPAISMEEARKSILKALQPTFELSEFDKYELANIGSYSFSTGSFNGKPTDFVDITSDVVTMLSVLNKENKNNEVLH